VNNGYNPHCQGSGNNLGEIKDVKTTKIGERNLLKIGFVHTTDRSLTMYDQVFDRIQPNVNATVSVSGG